MPRRRTAIPIYEYACVVCGLVVEKITQAPVVAPETISNRCERCQVPQPHTRRISVPARVGPPPPVQMSRENRDKSWKKRVMEGVNPDGKPLTNRLEQSARAWGMDDTSRITGKV